MNIQVNNSKGFTIIELMIALTIMSSILVLSSMVLIQIGSIYSKGVNIASLQNSNRNIVSDIAQAIQFGNSAPNSCAPVDPVTDPLTICQSGSLPGPIYAFCIDTTRYSFVMNRELLRDEGLATPLDTPHVLWRDTMRSANATCNPLPILTATDAGLNGDASTVAGSGYEMASSHTRLTRFYVHPSPTSGVYDIAIWMALGDSDLVNSHYNEHLGAATPALPTCNGGVGSQYCAVSNIETQVTRRKSN